MGRDSRIAMVRLGTDSRDFDRGLRSAEKSAQTWGNRVKGHISKSLKDGFGGLQGIAGLAGIAGFGALARDVKIFNDRLVRLQISANKGRGDMLKFNDELQRTASVTGASQDDILAGAQKYTELTGKFDEFAASMETFAKAQVATGASMEELVGAAAALSSNLEVHPEDMLAALDAITSQGKAGKIEIRDMAAELPNLTGQFSQFGTVGVKGVVELGAAMQIMAHGFGTASETSTGMQSLMTAFVKNSGKLQSLGVNVFTKGPNGVRKLRDFADIVFELIDKSKGDPKVLQKVLGRQEALQALLPLMHAGRAEFERLIAIGGKGGMIMEDYGTEIESAGGKMAIAEAHFKAVFNAAIMKNLDAMVAAFDALVRALSWIASHPEAVAGLALLWKGGGFLGTIAGMAPGGGAGAMLGGASSVAGGVGAARYLGSAGRAMQGAAVGYALSQAMGYADKGMEEVQSSAMTLTHAMAGLPGPIGMAAMAIAGFQDAILAVFNYANSEIDRTQANLAASDLGATAIANSQSAFGDLNSRSTREIVGADGQIKSVSDAFDPKMYLQMRSQMGLGVTGQMRGNASFLMKRGKNKGLFDALGNLDPSKLDAYLAADKSMKPYEREQMRSSFMLTEQMMREDPSMFLEFANYNRSGGALGGEATKNPWASGMGMSGPGASSPFSSLIEAGQSFMQSATAPGPQMGTMFGRPVMIQVTLEPGMVLKSDKASRRKGGR